MKDAVGVRLRLNGAEVVSDLRREGVQDDLGRSDACGRRRAGDVVQDVVIANRMESKTPKETREAGERVGGGLGRGHVQDREVDDGDVLDVRGRPF